MNAFSVSLLLSTISWSMPLFFFYGRAGKAREGRRAKAGFWVIVVEQEANQPFLSFCLSRPCSS